ncbi:hypothetical protein BKA93DRAFT_826945 [Sparassis latifolia]
MLPGALLDLFGAEKDLWTWTTWTTLIQVDHPPWSPEAKENPPEGWDENKALAVRAFTQKYFNTNAKARMNFMKKQADDYSEGRNMWIEWATDTYCMCKMNDVVDAVLVEQQYDPLSIMRILNISTLPPSTDVSLEDCCQVMAYKLFGMPSFYSNHMLRKSAKDFVLTMLIHSWERRAKVVKRDQMVIKKKRAEVDQLWKEMSEKMLIKKDIWHFLGQMKSLMVGLKRYDSDARLVIEFAAWKETLEAMQEVLKKDGNKIHAHMLPQAMLKGLESLSTPVEIFITQNKLKEALAVCEPDSDGDDSVLDNLDEVKWEESIKEVQDYTRDQLIDALGILLEVCGLAMRDLQKRSERGL